MEFTAVLEWDEEENVFNVSVPSLPGCYSWGHTRKQAMANIKDAILCYVEMSERHGEAVPVETELATVRIP